MSIKSIPDKLLALNTLCNDYWVANYGKEFPFSHIAKQAADELQRLNDEVNRLRELNAELVQQKLN